MTVIVYVKYAPGAIGSGVAETVTPASAWAGGATSTWTGVVQPEVLFSVFGSAVVALATVAVAEMLEPSAAPAFTETLNVKVAGEAPVVKFPVVAEIVPVLPTAGAVMVQPPSDEVESNVVPAGMGRLSVTSWESSGPSSATVTV